MGELTGAARLGMPNLDSQTLLTSPLEERHARQHGSLGGWSRCRFDRGRRVGRGRSGERPGSYPFIDDFHHETTGRIVAE